MAGVETTVVGRGVVARVSGEMDYVTGPGLWEQISEVLAGDTAFVVLDLSGVSFCDSAGLNLLLRADKEARLGGVELVLACVPQHLRRIVEMTGADQVLRIHDTVTEAEAAFGDRGDAAPSPA
ncbi:MULTISPECIES: anti-sigma factor antagonist [unclassified Streptomyces]|uniref:STAS domain-containing protein n=1 Tax=unclassified Streptomyces TaxID=2593676 RepID=UPI0036E1C533